MQDDKQTLKKDISSYLPQEIALEFQRLGLPGFRARQVFKWLSSGVLSFDEMTNLPLDLRDRLGEEYILREPGILKKQVSALDGTTKYLWSLQDENSVESVIMRYHHGNSLCISSQVGCRMGCKFCASTIGGLVRSLTPGEMLAQVLSSEKDYGERISNLVLMGIGEPLDNYDNFLRFLELVTHPEGRNLGMRHISVSTCGITEIIDKMGDLNLQLTLAVSLHAPDDETRERIMPINRSNPVDKLLDSCLKYFNKTGRRISYEYAMIDGLNDTDYHAALLADRMEKAKGHVNIIPLNNVIERAGFSPSSPENIERFRKNLLSRGVSVTVRRTLGGDIDASCGQLRRGYRQQSGDCAERISGGN